MKVITTKSILPTVRFLTLTLAMTLLGSYAALGSPFASCISNVSSTISFYLNESGGNVTVVYEDGSTNASFNPVYLSTGLNQAAGVHSFPLTGHSSYTIYVFKAGSGAASVITTVARTVARGITANINGASPYFGYVYSAIGGAGVVMQNSDGSGSVGGSLKAGATWGATTFSPDKLSVAADDYVIVGDFSKADASVVRVHPRFTTSELLLAGIGQPPSNGGTSPNHGSIESQPILTGTIGVNATLYLVDGSFASPYNQIMTYNIGATALPYATGPDVIGADVNPSGLLGYNDSGGFGFYAGLSRAANGYLYVNVARANHSNPNLQVYAADSVTPVWDSYVPGSGGTLDYFLDPPVGNTSAPSDSALSPDSKYLALVHIDNHLSLITLTNDSFGGGVPDISTLYAVANPAGAGGNGRGICWDAAGNLWMTSSGLGNVQQWTLGRTATAITAGNAAGPTSFQLLTPSTSVSVYNTNGPIASQANSYGNPTVGHFTIVRTGNLASPLAVSFTLTGSTYQTNGTYTPSATTTTTIGAGQATADVSITAITDGRPRPTGSVTLTLSPSGSYAVVPPSSATITMLNTGPQTLLAPAVGAPSMYKALSNDFASFGLTRWGDTGVVAYAVSSFNYSGTAVVGTDYTTPTTVTFNPGDVTHTVTVNPLVGGTVPYHSLNNPYVGNKTAIIGVNSGGGYTASPGTVSLTLVDDANPPSPMLWFDPLTNAVDGNGFDQYGRWNITYANKDMGGAGAGTLDYTVDFGYDLTTDVTKGIIPLPPNGDTHALRVTVNKTLGITAGVCLYPTNVTFGGDYAVRFNMNLVEGSSYPNNVTEGVQFGINHTGFLTNWWSGDGVTSRPNNDNSFQWQGDGVWLWMDADPGGAGNGDYIFYTGLGGSLPNTGWGYLSNGTFYDRFPNAFKNPAPYTTLPAFSGLPANSSPNATQIGPGPNANTWSDVEIKQVNKVITFAINKTVLYTSNFNAFANFTFTNGTIMLGYGDPFTSLGAVDAAAYFSNLRVVRLAPITITNITVSGGNVILGFTSTDGDDTPASFAVQSSSTVIPASSYTDVSPEATIVQLPNGTFQATVAYPAGAAKFYRIRHK